MSEAEMRELLEWIQKVTREALFTKGDGKDASRVRDLALSAINKSTKAFAK